MKASIILPTYNESGNIEELIRSIFKSRPDGWDYEVLVVDDNSPDGTFDLVRTSFKEDPNVSAILRSSDRGLAKSLRAGVERAQGEWVVLMDSDFTHDPADLSKMLHVARVYDIVIGSRFCPGGNMQDTQHYLMSLIYNWFIRIILRTQVQDNLGGYLVIRADVLRVLPWDKIFFGYGDYCFRLLHYAQNHRRTIVEVPVHFHPRRKGDSKSHFVRLLFSYTMALVKLKLAITRYAKSSQ